MEKIPKYERLLNLISVLMKSPLPVPWAEIRGRVEGYDDDADDASLKRRFERDKEELRTKGIPVEFEKTAAAPNGGYVIDSKTFFLPPVRIEPDEALTLSAVAGGLSGAKDVICREARSALLKLVASAPDQALALDSSDDSTLLALGLPSGAKTDENRFALSSALALRMPVSFRYQSLARKKPAPVTVDPYGLAVWGGRFYLVGHSHEHDEIRVWNFGRITSQIKPAGESRCYDIPANFNVRRYVGIAEWQFPTKSASLNDAIEAKILFHPDIAWMIEESRDAGASSSGEDFRRRKDGWGELTSRVTDPRSLVRWTLKFGEKARIAGPPSIVKIAREILAEAIEQHSS